MRKFAIIAATGVLVIGLSGCTTIQPVIDLIGGKSISSQAPVVSDDAKKALTITHLAYNAIGNELITAAQPGGILHGDNAKVAQEWYDKAGDALVVADKADKAADANGLLTAISQAQDAINAADALIHPAK